MDRDATIGVFLILGALSLMSFLLFWSKRTITRIAARGHRSVREIVKELNGEA